MGPEARGSKGRGPGGGEGRYQQTRASICYTTDISFIIKGLESGCSPSASLRYL